MSQSSQTPTPNPTLFNQLQQQGWFSQLQAELQQRQQWQQAFDRECPLELVGYCTVIGLKDQCLYVAVANASQATQLQFRAREIIAALKKTTPNQPLKQLRAQIMRLPLARVEQPVFANSTILSEKSKEMFVRLAEATEDVQLKAALLAWATPK